MNVLKFDEHFDVYVFFFFFQAEDGIRDYKVTGVQTCALPIFKTLLGQPARHLLGRLQAHAAVADAVAQPDQLQLPAGDVQDRSEERRVGKEGRSRWSPYH